MKILVTGGAGFIGSHIVERLHAGGHQVVVIDNLSSGKKENLPPQVRLEVLDVCSIEARNLIIKEKPEVVVHTAAQMSVSESMKNPHFDVEVNVAGFINLLDPMREGYSPFVVFLSTGGAIYGEQEVFPAPETHPICPTSVYGLSKRVAEMYLDYWARTFKLQYAALRLANVYGPRQNPHGEAGVVAIFCEKFLTSQTPTIFGDGLQTRDFVFVGDVVAAVEKVVTTKTTGTYNIGTGIETNVNELTEHIRNSLKTSIVPKRAPARQGDQIRSVIDGRLAEKKFGWKPAQSLAQGIQLTAEWFRDTFSGQAYDGVKNERA